MRPEGSRFFSTMASQGQPGYCADSPGRGWAYKPLTYRVTREPAHGTLTYQYGSFEYKPTAGYSGSDSFEYVAVNGGGDSNAITQQITLDPAYNRSPVCFDGSSTPVLRVGAGKTLGAGCFDPDGDPVTISYDLSATRGSLDEDAAPLPGPYGPGAKFVRYTAPADAGGGSDGYGYSATDDRGASPALPALHRSLRRLQRVAVVHQRLRALRGVRRPGRHAVDGPAVQRSGRRPDDL
jgi:hypothetical protein